LSSRPKRFIEELSLFNRGKKQDFEHAKEELEEFLEDGDVERINRKQRILFARRGIWKRAAGGSATNPQTPPCHFAGFV
jgi:hypothetical protein